MYVCSNLEYVCYTSGNVASLIQSGYDDGDGPVCQLASRHSNLTLKHRHVFFCVLGDIDIGLVWEKGDITSSYNHQCGIADALTCKCTIKIATL